MTKRTFYALIRQHGPDGDNKIVFVKKTGYAVPCPGYDLAMYHSDEPVDVDDRRTWWFVVDCCTGLSVGKGYTMKDASERALEILPKLDPEQYRKSCERARETYGAPPDHQFAYLWR